MADTKLGYSEGFRDTLLRIAKRQKPDLSETKVKKVLDELVNSWDDIENIGGLCIERELDESTKTFVDDLKETGLVSDYSDFCIENKPKYFQDPKPFVVDLSTENYLRIYANRTFMQEALLAHKLAALAKDSQKPSAATTKKLNEFRKDSGSLEINEEQLDAIETALNNRLSVISGGPGTGKTTTVTRVLEALLADNEDALIYVTAPTGKAKNRIFDSIKNSVEEHSNLFPLCAKCLGQLYLLANTIHMWLSTPTSAGIRPSANNPLECDILVIDEASMVDSEIAFALFTVIDPQKTRVIILGDMHQLAAVGPGAVYADISDPNGALKDKLTVLQKSYRFDDDKGIGKLAVAINSPLIGQSEPQHCEDVWKVLSEAQNSVEYVPQTDTSSPEVSQWLTKHLAAYIQAVKLHLCKDDVDKDDLQNVWKVFSSFRAIAAQRQGPGSVEDINKFCESLVKKELGISDEERNYPGKPIIIRHNDLSLKVANGDDGILYRPKDSNSWCAYIGESGISVPESLLNDYDTAYAITIHQSQGSGFPDVGVFLPNNIGDDKQSGLATRELLYTAVTRAENHCAIFGSKAVLEKCVSTKTKRTGGLAVRLEEFRRPKQNG